MTLPVASRWRRAALFGAVALAFLSLLGLRVAAGQSAVNPVASASAAKKVTIADFAFRPTSLTVAAGTRIAFANSDSVAHTATADRGAFETGRIKPGRSASITLKRPGTYLFHCSIHPYMHGKIVVG